MNATLINIDATLQRILEVLEAKHKRERAPKVELTDAQWQAKMVEMYPNFDVPQLLRDAEAHYVSEGKVFTRKMGAAWLRRQCEWNKPATAPPQKKGLVL